ncbi:hypothetical protein HQ524_01785 [Candidatus Uhrbacteria bacterium]|nr:hypothetical protein [Candidatus Uhrbacteria bacterium]
MSESREFVPKGAMKMVDEEQAVDLAREQARGEALDQIGELLERIQGNAERPKEEYWEKQRGITQPGRLDMERRDIANVNALMRDLCGDDVQVQVGDRGTAEFHFKKGKNNQDDRYIFKFLPSETEQAVEGGLSPIGTEMGPDAKPSSDYLTIDPERLPDRITDDKYREEFAMANSDNWNELFTFGENVYSTELFSRPTIAIDSSLVKRRVEQSLDIRNTARIAGMIVDGLQGGEEGDVAS